MIDTTIEVLPAEGDVATQIRARLVTINRTTAELVLENGRLLRDVMTNAIYKEWGHASFNQAIDAMQDAGLLTYGHRNARNFIAVVDMADTLHLDDSIQTLGISKLREIASLKSSDDQSDVLDRAGEMSVAQVVATVKAIKDMRAGRKEDPFMPLLLKFTATQHACFDATIAATRTVHGINDNVPVESILVDVIMADWYAGLPTVEAGIDIPEEG